MSKKRRRASNPSRPAAVFMVNNFGHGARDISPAQGRFYCAKWLEERRNTADLDRLVHILVERVDTLLEALYDLKDDVLYKPNMQAFKRAKAIDDLIREYLEGRHV